MNDRLISMLSRQSLVTPIDWKPKADHGGLGSNGHGRQSLVTPIDWKRAYRQRSAGRQGESRQSLVTPIDWKLAGAVPCRK